MINFKDKRVWGIITVVAIALLFSGGISQLALVSTDSNFIPNGSLSSKLDLDKATYTQQADGSVIVALEKLTLKNTASPSLFNPKTVVVQLQTIEIFKSTDPATPIKTINIKDTSNINPVAKTNIEIKPGTTKEINYIIRTSFIATHDSFFVRVKGAVFGPGGVGGVVNVGQDSGNINLLPGEEPEPTPTPLPQPPTPTPTPTPEPQPPIPVPTPVPIPTPIPITYELIEKESSSKLRSIDLRTNTTTIYGGTLEIDDKIIKVGRIDGTISTFNTEGAEIVNQHYEFTDGVGNVVYIPIDAGADNTLLVSIIAIVAFFAILLIPKIPKGWKLILWVIEGAVLAIAYFIGVF